MSMFNKPLYRRGFLMSLAGGAGVCSLLAAVDKSGKGGKVRLAEFDPNGNKTGVVEVEKVVKTDAEWKKQLDGEQFEVERRARRESGEIDVADRRAGDIVVAKRSLQPADVP